jgi:hypothetical protein
MIFPGEMFMTRMRGTVSSKNRYSVHPGVQMMQKWIQELPQKTGKSLEQWITFIRKNGPKDEAACREWLKKEHGLGSNSAWWLAERSRPKGELGIHDDDPESYLKLAVQYVEQQYSGKKAALRPIYDALLDLGLQLGNEAKACPCKTMVPLYRNHVFAELKPASNTRIDLGLSLSPLVKSGEKLPARLIDTGGFKKKDRITHRIPISTLEEIDAEVKKWLKTAYDLDAKA